MFFKKKKIAKTPIHSKSIIYILTSIGIVGIFCLGVFAIGAVENMNFKVFEFTQTTNSGATEQKNVFRIPLTGTKQEEKETKYILLTGRGGGSHDAPDLTDTLIIAGINPKSQTISMLSVPRDLYVKYPSSTRKGKINGIYEHNINKGESLAISRLKEKLGEITGIEIDYYLNIDFQGFIEVVDVLGGVEVTLENNFVDYEFPDGNLGYKSFILRKGTWNLDGDVALMYARSRHSTSDFDRSLRQQEILGSLRKKVGELGYFRDRKKILELYNIFIDYVETDMGFTDMLSIGLEIRGWGETKTLSFNLNDSCYSGSPDCSVGGFLYVPLREYFGGASVLLANQANKNSLDEFEEIQKFSNYVFTKPSIYSDSHDIVIYNTTNIPLFAGSLADVLQPYGFNIDKQTGTRSLREKIFENSILYYNGIDENDATLIALQDFVDIEMVRVDSPIESENNVRIEIFLADDNSFLK